MATLRKSKCYRRIKRAFTRKSKYKKKGFIKVIPPIKIIRWDMGNPAGTFTHRVDLISKDDAQIRQNSIESGRLAGNRRLEEKLTKPFYFLKLRVYPHQILRENKMLTGAGADRMQTGMSHAFGKPTGIAAQMKKGQVLFTVFVNKEGIPIAREALEVMRPRLSGHWKIEIKENK